MIARVAIVEGLSVVARVAIAEVVAQVRCRKGVH